MEPPTIIIVGGPNGAGKTTFINEWLDGPRVDLPFLNADEIGREPAQAFLPAASRDIRAGRILLSRLGELIQARRSIVLETTLSSRLHARRIPEWRRKGYRVELVFLRLDSVEVSISRVATRVANGGHGVPESDLRRRFERSLWNLEHVYKPLVDVWEVWESQAAQRILVERSPL